MNSEQFYRAWEAIYDTEIKELSRRYGIAWKRISSAGNESRLVNQLVEGAGTDREKLTLEKEL